MFAKDLDFQMLFAQSKLHKPLYLFAIAGLCRTKFNAHILYILLHKHTVTFSQSFLKTQKCALEIVVVLTLQP